MTVAGDHNRPAHDVLRVAVTGGIGSGKSTVAGLLRDCGARVIDADALAREVLNPGTPELIRVVEAFGPEVLAADGTLDRAALAARVFSDTEARSRLEAIVHPAVQQLAAALMRDVPAGGVVVYDVPLLVETGRAAEFDVVVVVEAPVELRLRRLAQRGLAEADARARMSTQASDEQRRAVAHAAITNDGDLPALVQQVQSLWSRLRPPAATNRSASSVPSELQAKLRQQVGKQTDGVRLDP